MTDTKELRKLLAAATPGEWQAYENRSGTLYVAAGGEIVFFAANDDGTQDANTDLIVALHNATPALLDELDALRADAERYRWLRSNGHDWEVFIPTDKNASGHAVWHGYTDMDAAIDAARVTKGDEEQK